MKKRSLGGKADSPSLHGRGTPAPSWQEELRAKAHASLSAVLQKPAATQSPRRWKQQLQQARSEVQKHAANAQHLAALAHAAEEKIQAAEARAGEMERRMRTAENRAQALEQRALTAEAAIARLETQPIVNAPSSLAPDYADALRQLQESLLNAEERARRAEMRAYDMEQRSLAAEAIIAGSR